MLTATIVMAVIAIAMLAFGHFQGEGKHLAGLRLGSGMTLQVLPLLILAFMVAGMAQAMIPAELVSRWVGTGSGWRGIMVGTIAGGLAPGGPYVSLPVAAALFKSGAGLGTMVAFMTGWSLWAFARLPMEVAILGWRLTLVRLACTFFFPPVAGFLANFLFNRS